jgi:hypothetical protein
VKPLKKIIKLKTMHRALSWLAAQYIRLVYLTGVWEVVGGEIPEKLARKDFDDAVLLETRKTDLYFNVPTPRRTVQR